MRFRYFAHFPGSFFVKYTPRLRIITRVSDRHDIETTVNRSRWMGRREERRRKTRVFTSDIVFNGFNDGPLRGRLVSEARATHTITAAAGASRGGRSRRGAERAVKAACLLLRDRVLGVLYTYRHRRCHTAAAVTRRPPRRPPTAAGGHTV